MTSCPTCENPFDSADSSKCPKCGEPLRPYRSLLEVDVAHAGESLGSKLRKKLKELLTKVFVNNTRVKIIHGSGRTTGRSVIRGKAIDLLGELARSTGGRLVQDNGNPGAHILWLNR